MQLIGGPQQIRADTAGRGPAPPRPIAQFMAARRGGLPVDFAGPSSFHRRANLIDPIEEDRDVRHVPPPQFEHQRDQFLSQIKPGLRVALDHNRQGEALGEIPREQGGDRY